MSRTPLRIVVGITGGIAAYKAVSVVREFVKDGHHVDVVATEAALQFVGRPTLEAISRNPVNVGLYDDVAQVRHVALGQQADVIVVAPATANTLAQFAAGLAPDLLGNTVLARRGPLVVAPAMHTEMWENPATQANISTLRSRGVVVVGPGVGQLTGSDSGPGRMSEPEDIIAAAYEAVSGETKHDLVGKRILITGGGTREPLDPVRFIGNRSSGKQAVALAQRAMQRSADVTLIAAHLEVEPPAGVDLVTVSTAAQMHSEVMTLSPEFDIVIMAAAVSDYRLDTVSGSKLKKVDNGGELHLTLVENPDILKELSSSKSAKQLIIGFAAETATEDDLIRIGKDKIARKGCDLLILNQVGWDQGFGTESNTVSVLASGGDILITATGSKMSVADTILDCIATPPIHNA
ncbi:bifunctional phosphopantothenoylcysteine decarboxylase/phosphopantothenate--cysteine ligase CoaBC [Aurantimicrobium minutum]|uniref:bifunctional phosphopantothenoylcysteine decarboxylase/phosphopantothenate--cysteine ligase CoaBC n=1 Tax=Aurantimicrobium minutum TaxID=708131 RepID=UPI002475F84A|nr:bifunctional phosphopantothenoylcysteine decarboxylase/phosphopantothenate--cysteine ligase CoaBC [Aurantimicrobium minutum]MDH6239381.1 phosphopantothenoylcysteine decarboxylase/phosphopantothenate--cysteine ligase [Aurantimicrobium minutum]